MNPLREQAAKHLADLTKLSIPQTSQNQTSLNRISRFLFNHLEPFLATGAPSYTTSPTYALGLLIRRARGRPFSLHSGLSPYRQCWVQLGTIQGPTMPTFARAICAVLLLDIVEENPNQ